MPFRRNGASVYLLLCHDTPNTKVVRDYNWTMSFAIAAKRIVAVGEATIRARVRRVIHNALGRRYFFWGERTVLVCSFEIVVCLSPVAGR